MCKGTLDLKVIYNGSYPRVVLILYIGQEKIGCSGSAARVGLGWNF